MNNLYDEYHDQGLEIIALPSNDFLTEKDTNQEIIDFNAEKYKSKFVMLSKDHVNGKDTCELFSWLRQNSDLHSKRSGKSGRILWNFEKFLIDKNGRVHKRFSIIADPGTFNDEIMELLE